MQTRQKLPSLTLLFCKEQLSGRGNRYIHTLVFCVPALHQIISNWVIFQILHFLHMHWKHCMIHFQEIHQWMQHQRKTILHCMIIWHFQLPHQTMQAVTSIYTSIARCINTTNQPAVDSERKTRHIVIAQFFDTPNWFTIHTHTRACFVLKK